MSSPTLPAEPPWRAGLRGARANLLPGLVLQAAALALVLTYYFHPPAHRALDSLAAFRSEVGVVFGIVSTGLFGGIIPWLYLRSHRATRYRYTASQGAAVTAFWAYKGFEIDLLYRFLAHVVGTGNDVSTIATKAAIDQLIYCPLFAVPVTALVYDWINARFDGRAIGRDIQAGRWYRRRAVPILISNLGVWVPTVCIIYSLPTPLQLPLQNLVLCFFTLMLAHMVEPSRRA